MSVEIFDRVKCASVISQSVNYKAKNCISSVAGKDGFTEGAKSNKLILLSAQKPPLLLIEIVRWKINTVNKKDFVKKFEAFKCCEFNLIISRYAHKSTLSPYDYYMIILCSSINHFTVMTLKIILWSSYNHLTIILQSSYDHLTIILWLSFSHCIILLKSEYDHSQDHHLMIIL